MGSACLNLLCRRALSARVDLTRAEVFDASIRDRTALIGVIGLGYAGLPLAVGFAEAGFEVGGVDTNSQTGDRGQRTGRATCPTSAPTRCASCRI